MLTIDKTKVDEIIDGLLGNNDLTASPEVWYGLHQIRSLQPVATDTNVGDTISLQAAIDALDCINGTEEVLRSLPPVQPEPTDEQVLDYCKKRCLYIVTADIFQSTHLTHKVSFGDKDHVWIDGKQYISLRRFQEAVKEAGPKEGYWIEGGIYRDVIECYCSECGQLMTTAASVRMNYCPNCGVK